MAWLLQGDAYLGFVELVREYLPEREKAILGQAGVGVRIVAFANHFRDRYFDLPGYFEDGEAEEYADLTGGIPILLRGIGWEEYDQLPDWLASYQVLAALCENPHGSEGEEDGDDARIALLESWRWALPPKVKVPPDELLARVDIYGETVVLRLYENGVVTTRPVSALDIAHALYAEIRLSSGLLPEGALWWASGREGQEVALWLPPRVWPTALQVEAFKPPRRFRLPMPGLVFLCRAGRPPKVFAAKRRPTGPKAQLYHAPLFNVFRDGRTCAGSQHYGTDIDKHSWEFFTSFFTHAAHVEGRSKRYPKDLRALWGELDGKRRFPLGDLVPCVKVADLLPEGGEA